MDIVDDRDGLTRLRIGCVLDAEVIRKEAELPDNADGIDGCCIAVWIPPALLEMLGAPGSAVQQRLDVLLAPGSDEQLVLLTVQANGAQMRLLMPLGDQDVQQYLLDCMQRGRIRMLLADEATKELAFMDLPGGFRSPELVRRLLSESKGAQRDAQTLVRLGRLLCPLEGVRSLIPGQAVNDAITVLVQGGPAAALRPGASFLKPGKKSLH